MALNAIKAPLVEYDKQANITVNGAEVSVGSAVAKYITTTIAKQQNISKDTLTNASDANPNYLVEFGEKYLPNLRLVSDDDEFDRPSHTWIYKSEEIGTYVDYENLVETFTVAVTGKDLYETIGSSTIKEYDVYYYEDGAEDETIKASNMIRTNTKEYDTTGNGVLTQVFVDHDKKEIIITSIHTYLAQATAVWPRLWMWKRSPASRTTRRMTMCWSTGPKSAVRPAVPTASSRWSRLPILRSLRTRS